jgi:hypothetical protein
MDRGLCIQKFAPSLFVHGPFPSSATRANLLYPSNIMADLSSTNAGSTSSKTTFPFMKLAPELRNHIYGFVFQGIDEIPTARSGKRIPRPASAQIDSTTSHYKSIKDLQPYLALSRTSHCVRHESLFMLFERYIAQHSWLVASSDSATALFDLTNFIRAVTSANAENMHLCLLSRVGTPSPLMERSFTRRAMNLMVRSSAFGDWSVLPCPLPLLRSTPPRGASSGGGIAPSASMTVPSLTTAVPAPAHCERARGHQNIARCIPGYIFDCPESDYRLVCAIDQYFLLEGRLAMLDWSSLDFEHPAL